MNVRQEKTNTANDHRDLAVYSLTEAARYLRLPVATLRSWTFGREYPAVSGRGVFHPLVRPASRRPPLLSFSNLIEAHVLRSFRTEHGISVKALRSALKYAEKELGIDRLLLREELCTEAGRIFLDRYGELIELSASGQVAMHCVFTEHLRRVDWASRFAARLYPFVSAIALGEARPIVIDPLIAFGRPVLAGVRISTSAIADRIDAGESIKDLADDYQLRPAEIEQAVLYERAA